MKLKIIVAISAVLFLYIALRILLSFANEAAREYDEHEKYCESFRILKWTALVSDEGKYWLASLYARGDCVDQDVERAKALYSDIDSNGSIALGRILFYQAFEVADENQRNSGQLNTSVITPLIVEAKSLGFSPNDEDFSALQKSNLQQIYERAEAR